MLTNSNHDHTLVFEARIQAKIDHPNICKIYQVEQASSQNPHSYIVMQYIEGLSALKWLELQGGSIEPYHVIELMQKVCDGLQVLHAQGIIHRDIKPENIMLAEDQHLGLQPFVVDFGLANKDMPDKSPNNSKTVKGTPAYMSPEQWQNAKLDSRSDVYSIGATLYLLLTGTRPVPVDAPSAVNRFDHPNWLALPLDLQTIVRKCMNEQREKRYQSARELNQELQRYLAGEPIISLKNNRYWLKKKLLKYKWPVMLYTTLTLSVLTSGIWYQYQAHQQQTREQLIAKFSSKVENLDANVRLSKMTLPHDISQESQQWQQQIEQLQTEMKNIGDIAFGPGHYAIGRMYYTLQQYDQALEHLQMAWRSGFKQQRVAYNLALSHGAIYQRQKAITNNITSTTARSDKLQQLNNEHRQPAIKLLKQSLDNSPYQSFTQALLHYYQQDYPKALEQLTKTDDLPSWFYQHHVLRGDIMLSKTVKVGAAHIDKQVHQFAEQALKSYHIAAQIGRSDLQLKLKPVNVYLRLLNNSIYGKQDDFSALYHKATQVLEQAKVINANHPQIFAYQGRLFALLRKYQEQHSGDPLIASQHEIDNFKKAITLEPKNADLHIALGMAYTAKIKLLKQQDMPIEQLFPVALTTFAQVPENQKDYTYYNYIAALNHELAVHQAQKYASKTLAAPIERNVPQNEKYFGNAIASYQSAIDKKPDAIGAYLNLGLVYRDWSHWVEPTHAIDKFNRAITYYQQAKTLNPNHFVLNFNLTQSHNNLARINTFLAGNIEQNISDAQTYLNISQKLNPNHPFVMLESANLNTIIAIDQWQKGCPYQPWFDKAKADLEKALSASPNHTILRDGRAWIYALEQQVSYFAHHNTIVKTASFDTALTLSKDINSKKWQHHLLIALLNHQHHQFTPQAFNDLPIIPDAKLAFAEWLSQQQQFAKAETIFNSITRIFPSILWHYQLNHLQRWSQALSQSNQATTQTQIEQKTATLKQKLYRRYPALVADTNHNNTDNSCNITH